MSGPLVIDGDSWADVTIGGITKKVDLWRAFNTFLVYDRCAREENPGEDRDAERQIAYSVKVIEYLHGIGFENVGDGAADQFDESLMEAVNTLKKAKAPAPTPV